MTVSVGVVGAGRMGLPICRVLVERGFEVRATDTSAAREAPVRESGSGWASESDLVAASETVVTVLPGRREVESALPGILQRMPPGSCWLDLTSGDPELTSRLAAEAAERGIAAVAAPMGGGPADAAAGTLTFFAGGSDADLLRVGPILDALGAVERAGAHPGDGQTAKLLANLLWFGQVVAVTEAMLLGQSLGLEPEALRSLLSRSAGGSRFIDDHLGLLLDGDYAESFGLDRCVEELQTVVRLAATTSTPFELSALVTRLHEEALDNFGARDGELLAALLLEERAGRMLRR